MDTYTKIIQNAWQAFWRNRALWIFGVLLALTTFSWESMILYGRGNRNQEQTSSPQMFLVMLPNQNMVHVFGDATARTAEEVKQRWSRIKSEEKKDGSTASVLDSVPETLPALMRSYRISERAARTGFDWKDISGVIQKAEEEWHEFKNEMADDDGNQGNAKDRAMELGDVLFTLVNVGRLSKIHPEEALISATKKFEIRFKAMEKLARENQRPFESLTFEEMHVLWDKVKKHIPA